MGQRRKILTPEVSAACRWGAELRARRDRNGLSLAELAARVQFDAGYLGRCERGERVPSGKLAKACDRELGAGGELVRLWHQADSERARKTDGDAGYPASLAASVSLLEDVTGADIGDSPAVVQAAWVPGVVPAAISGYLFSGRDWAGQDGGIPVLPRPGGGPGAAGRIRDFTRMLMDLDFRYGGGHTRKILLFYFRSEIVPLLHASRAGRARSGLFSAAAEVAQLLGWSAYDSGRHGAAQKYFIQGLRLAAEAGDTVLGGRLLSNLSHQANYLGHFSEALQLARAAQSAAASRATPAVRAMFLAMEARALASCGEPAACASVLHRAERELARRGGDPEWISYFDDLELAGEAAHCARDLGQARETREFAARALDPAITPPRTRAFIEMVTAAGALCAGNLDEALALASGAVELAGGLQSSRYLRYVRDFHASLAAAHPADPAVRGFTELLTAAYPAMQLDRAA